MNSIKPLSRAEKIQMIQLLEEQERREQNNKLKNFKPYEFGRKYIAASKNNKQIMLMAANRIGKTEHAVYALACHLTGYYPDWWDGIKFNYAPTCWALGVSGEQIRDVLQLKLFGVLGDRTFESPGFISSELVDFDKLVRSKEKGLAKDVYVKHKSGRLSFLSFKSYSQGQHALMGSGIDYILIDEEPEDPEIYPQCVTRTMTGNKGEGGIVALSFTPENGETILVHQFTSEIQEGQALITATWDDAPHLTEAIKKQILAAIPEHQREMRSRGIPLLGSGAVFTIPESRYKGYIPEIQTKGIPKHYFQLGGIDFGYGGEHPSAVAYGAYDADRDIVYIHDGFKNVGGTVIEVASLMRKRKLWIPIAYPHDGEAVKMGKGGVYEQTAQQYRNEDIEMMSHHATFEDGTYGVEAGVMEIIMRMKTGRLIIAPHLTEWFEESKLYHRKNGQIVKVRDDFISAVRYLIMMIRYAERAPIEDRIESESSVKGYWG